MYHIFKGKKRLLPAQGQGTDPGITWETVAVQVLEESPETAARTLVDWARSGQTAPEEDAVLALLEEMGAEPAASAAAFDAVLDAADSLREAGEAPELGEETYRAAVRSLSPFFTRLLETETTPWREESSAWPADLAAFDGIWCDSTLQELLIFRNGTCRVVIPYLDYYGETAFPARLRATNPAISPGRWPITSPVWRRTISGAIPRDSGLTDSGPQSHPGTAV